MIDFGTGGFRGIIGDTFTKENIQLIAQALANIIKKEKSDKKITDFSKPAFSCGIATLVTGIFCGMILSAILGVLAVTFGAISYVQTKSKKAIAGLIMGIVGVVLSILRFSLYF